MDQTAVKKLRVLAQTNDDVFAPAMFKHLQQICMVKDHAKLVLRSDADPAALTGSGAGCKWLVVIDDFYSEYRTTMEQVYHCRVDFEAGWRAFKKLVDDAAEAAQKAKDDAAAKAADAKVPQTGDFVKLTKARHHRDATYKVINGQHYESCIQRVDQFGCLIGYSSWFKTADLTKVKVSKLMQSRSAT